MALPVGHNALRSEIWRCGLLGLALAGTAAMALLLAACTTPALPPPPTPDVQATIELGVRATLAAQPSGTAPPTPAPPVATPTAAPPSPTAAPTSAPQLSESDVAQRARRWLVHVTHGRSTGSGVVVAPDGLILTNHHVVEGRGTTRVTLPNGGVAFAEVLLEDSDVDLALLRVPHADLEPAAFADTSRLRTGDPLVVAGFALNLPGEPSISRGVFSGRRAVPSTRLEFLQTDAAMNPGVSGGPMLNLAGEVVGINTWGIVRTPTGSPVQGVNFAIPAEVAQAFVASASTSAVASSAPRTDRPTTAAPVQVISAERFWTVTVVTYLDTPTGARLSQAAVGELNANGLPAEVLRSSLYATMRPGYLVVHSGRFGSMSEATGQLARVKSAGYPNAYVREVVPAQADPVAAVRQFYTFIDARQLDAAWGLLSPRFQSEWNHETWVAGYNATRSVTLLSVEPRVQAGTNATVAVSVESVDEVGVTKVTKAFEGSWDLVIIGGAWKLDRGNIRQVR